MAKRESRQKSRQSVAIRGENKWLKGDRDIVTVLAREWTNDREKLRRVREWAEKMEQSCRLNSEADVAIEVLAILNGTERKGKR